MAEDKKKEQKKFAIVEVPTEMGLMFQNTETKDNLSQMELLLDIANRIAKIEENLG